MSDNQNVKNYTAMELILAIVVLFFPAVILQAVTVVEFIGALTLLSGFLVLGVVGILELVAGVAMVGIGMEKLFSIPMGAFSVIGFGIINIGIALLLECLVFWLFFVLLPAFFRKITGKEVRHEKTS